MKSLVLGFYLSLNKFSELFLSARYLRLCFMDDLVLGDAKTWLKKFVSRCKENIGNVPLIFLGGIKKRIGILHSSILLGNMTLGLVR